MAQTPCTLGGYIYLYNPLPSTNPLVRAISATPTLTGRRFTDFGTGASRRDITQRWETMEAAFFTALEGKAAEGGTHAYVDEYGTSWTVIVRAPTYAKVTPGGDAYIDVSLTMHVVSQP